jgi:prepilin-type N-terminal cleavage/methylation domain-containing protein
MASEDEGFTLIELLVVMVIVGLLAAIAIPSFLSQKRNAYRTAMKSDLVSLVTSESSWNVDNDSWTGDLATLTNEGFRASAGVTAHVKVVGTSFVACTKHVAVPDWLVYDSATQSMSKSFADCA